jgi:hypothetical protein
MEYVNQLISESLKAGHSIDKIVQDLNKSDDPDEKAWATNWINTASRPEYAPGAGIKKEDNLTPMLDFVKENPKTAAGIAAATYAVTKIPKAIAYYEDRKLKKEELAIKRLSAESYAKQVATSPLQAVEDLTHADVANMVKTERNVTGKPNPLAASFEEKFKMPLAEAEQLSNGKITNAVDAEIVGNALTKGRGFSVNPMLGSVGNAPAGIPSAVNPINQFIPPAAPQPPAGAVAPQAMPTPPAAPVSVSAAVAGGVNPTQAINQTIAQEIDAVPTELRTGTGKIAYAGQGPEPKMGKKGPQFRNEYQSLEAVPKGYAFVPGAQYIDPLRQDLGQIEYTKAFTGRDFPPTYEEAVATGKDINRSLGRATRAEAQAAGLPPAEVTPGIAQKTTENKKLVKIIGKAGLTGALVSLADLALAKTPEDRANAGIGLLGAILPPGMDINAASAPGLPQSQVNNAYLLGSPYAQTQAAKDFRMSQKAGAGQGRRGIAPPNQR